MSKPEIKVIPQSEVTRLVESGYQRLVGGDASKANSDYFMVFVRNDKDVRDVKIVCPTFLRGTLGINQGGRSLSY